MNRCDFSDVKKLVSNLSGVPEEGIAYETALVEELHLDSLKFVELMAIIAEEYDAVVEEEDAVNLQTVGQVYEFISRKGC